MASYTWTTPTHTTNRFNLNFLCVMWNSDVEYGDFFVCTFSINEDKSPETGMHIEWIYRDPDL